MSKIHVLDPLIANKIAAGEVVEKPASVIKELVENAIDAGAKNITVEIKGGGKTYIRISDDGHGIEPDDMLTAFERHATSKISAIDDIYNIQSLGFRGEALASIASVSNIELISKVRENEFGERLALAGGKILSRESVGASNGTTIVMKDLFFNTPARLKFLKSDGAEQNAISTIVNKLALSHTSISFNYIINDRITFKTPGNGELKDAVYEIYGKSVSSELIPFELEETGGVIASGLLSTIHYTRGNRQLQVVFVNGRYVVNKLVSEALELAYKGLVPLHRHPICFLFLELDPKTIDVNIHPSKTEIKFHQEASIKQTLYSALRKTINSYNQVPQESFKKVDVFSRPLPEATASTEIKSEPKTTIDTQERTVVTSAAPLSSKESLANHDLKGNSLTSNSVKEEGSAEHPVRESINTNRPVPPKKALDLLYKSVHEKQETNEAKIIPQQANDVPSTTADPIRPTYDGNNQRKVHMPSVSEKPHGTQYDFKELLIRETVEITDSEPEYLPEGQSVYDELHYIGQAFSCYLMFEKDKQLYFVDQHAAHEKILYESFKDKYRNRQMEAQMLLDPITISMTYNEQEALLDNVEAFQQLGFEVEAFGMNDIIVRSVPILFDRPAGKLFIESIIETIADHKDLTTLQNEGIIMQSCKAAIKANQRIHELEVNTMLKDLRNLEDPYTCPHGRPIIIAIHEYEIERKFKRS